MRRQPEQTVPFHTVDRGASPNFTSCVALHPGCGLDLGGGSFLIFDFEVDHVIC